MQGDKVGRSNEKKRVKDLLTKIIFDLKCST